MSPVFSNHQIYLQIEVPRERIPVATTTLKLRLRDSIKGSKDLEVRVLDPAQGESRVKGKNT